MKIKFKASVNQYNELIQFVAWIPSGRIALSDIEMINLKYFYFEGMRKIQSLSFHTRDPKHLRKEKQFTIDVNHYEALKKALGQCESIGIAFSKSIFQSIKATAEPQILRAVSGYRLVG